MTKDEALRAALAMYYSDKDIAAIKQALEQPEPPPQCVTEAEKTAFAFGWWKALETQALQTKHEWVGLTDEEISVIVRGTHNTGSFVRAIEAKLKQKNGHDNNI